ncbi:MAG: RNA methyltransferase [Bacteriovoracaceae bacterium]|nr:RNA methyltransferase [Bacteroidota bacterium]
MQKLTHEEISKNRKKLEEFPSIQRNPIYAMADNIRSLYNVGSIFRSSDGALVEKLFLTGFTPHPPRKEIDKTALGATNTVPWEYHKDPLSAVTYLKKEMVKICVLELTTKSVPYYDLTKENFPLCLVFGNEITGVSKDVIEQADMAIEIPMFGNKQSLNVAVAYGIVLYDCLRILHHRRQG